MDKFVLQVKPTTSEAEEENWKTFNLMNFPVNELLDTEIRLAYEVESNRFKIGREVGSPASRRTFINIPGRTRISQHIEDTLTHGRIVNLDQYKLNVYGKGGFFKPHVDSPSGHDMIGTLVLCLPSPHKGGELYVNHDGLQHVFDFSQHSDDQSKVQWAAFYSDCIHEVKPVLEGHRMTVTYNITLPPSNWDHKRYFSSENVPEKLKEHFEASTESPSLTTKAFADIHSEFEKIRQNKRSSPFQIGLLLRHKYTLKGLQPQLLKGEDKVLFDILMEKKWKCKLMSVLSRYQTAMVYPYGLAGEDRELDETHEVFEFNPSAAKRHWGSAHDVPRHDQPWRRYREGYHQWRVGIPFIDIFRRAENGEQVVRNKEGEGIWIGNEVEDVGVDKIYLNSAAIVNLGQ